MNFSSHTPIHPIHKTKLSSYIACSAPYLLLLFLNACFTGVESTPRISASDVKKENIVTTAEQFFLSDIVATPPSQWQKGKEFIVTDNKISLIFSETSTAGKDSLSGKKIIFNDFAPAMSLTGDTVIEARFLAEGGELAYRTDAPYTSLATRQSLDVPFTIERSLVDSVATRLKDKRYYVVTPLWYEADGSRTVAGLRHVPVDIVDVVPGNSLYPIRIVFRQPDSDRLYSVYMTYGNQKSATRNFHTLFAFEDPRSKYPHITDETWQLITHSDVRKGMTRDECRLALGAPLTIGQHPMRGYMTEHWQYPDGIYLIFEDGVLINYRK